jgi:hypothetical protein
MATLEEIEKRRAERRDGHEKARKEQEAIDLEAIDALEEARGEPLHTMTANRFTAGVPVIAAFRAPSLDEYKRFTDMAGRAQDKKDSAARKTALEMLAAACWEYPAKDADARTAMLAAVPGVLMSLAVEVIKVAELASEAEGKG